MLVILVWLVLLVLFLFNADCTFNLWFWSKVGRRTEDEHYRNKVIWVVGASSGIGEAVALRLARFSPLLILSARRTDLLEDVAEKCKEASRSCQVNILPFDIVDFGKMQEKTKEADEIYGRKIDIVVLNAGRSQRAEWTDINPSVDAACYEVNAIGPTQVARTLLRQRGLHPTGSATDNLQFIVMSSVASLVPAILSASYTAAKAALNQYFRLLAVEMGEKGVAVSIICPSHVYAPNMLKAAFTADVGTEHGEVLQERRKAQMEPERAAELILLAGVHKIHECVLSRTPSTIAAVYICASIPGVFARFVNFVGAQRLRNLRAAHE